MFGDPLPLSPPTAPSSAEDLDNDEENYRDDLRGVSPPPFGPSVVIQRRGPWSDTFGGLDRSETKRRLLGIATKRGS